MTSDAIEFAIVMAVILVPVIFLIGMFMLLELYKDRIKHKRMMELIKHGYNYSCKSTTYRRY